MTENPIEILRGWISTGALLGLLTLAARLWIQNRKLRMQEKIDDRQGFGALIEALSGEVADLRVENGVLRREVRELHGIIDGIARGDLQARTSAQVLDIRANSTVIPPATAAALDRIEGKKE